MYFIQNILPLSLCNVLELKARRRTRRRRRRRRSWRRSWRSWRWSWGGFFLEHDPEQIL